MSSSAVSSLVNDQAIEISISFNGENKRLSLEVIPSNNKQFTLMNRKISRWFKIGKGQEFVMQYIDSEKDLITIGSAIELEEAITQSSPLELTLSLKTSTQQVDKVRAIKPHHQRHHFDHRTPILAMEANHHQPKVPTIDSTMVIERTSERKIRGPNRNASHNKDRLVHRIEKAESKFATELRVLESKSLIGNSPIARLRCIRLLKKFDGDISRVIERLESNRTHPTSTSEHHFRHGHHRHHEQVRLDRIKTARVGGNQQLLNKHEFQQVILKFSEELAKLKQMGYKRKRVLATLLNQHNGNIEAVLASLNTC